MQTVLEDNQATNPRYSKELEWIQQFHEGPLKRCSQCGRLVFHPCLVCATERKTRVRDPFDDDPTERGDFPIELRDNERRRYEHFHAQKMKDELAKERSTSLLE